MFSHFFFFFFFFFLIRLASHTEGKKTVIINRSRHQEDRRIKFRNCLGYRNFELSSPHIIERYEGDTNTGSRSSQYFFNSYTNISFFSRKSYPDISYIFFPNKRLRSLKFFTHIPLSCNSYTDPYSYSNLVLTIASDLYQQQHF